ncbi:hypothetical protein [Kineosporia mesophila]|uniref:hypothetical protein n=1 Tax=Kineosporia mesophila TaxID=566012 RepID=UPI0031E8D1D8
MDGAVDLDAAAGRLMNLPRRSLGDAPGRVFLTLVAADAVLTLWAFTAPGVWFRPWLVAASGWLVLGALWAMRAGSAFRRNGGVSAWSRDAWRWLAVPLVAIAVTAMVEAGLPLRVALITAEPAMKRFADDPQAAEPSHVGVYPLSWVDRRAGGGAEFLLDGAGFFDEYGIVYSPTSLPRSNGSNSRYEHITGPWYVMIVGM